ncbi:MAG: transposase [Acidobacteria bacterium]|nr:MAG: transposase [Acidobacteriota bacterium]RPJ63774.1 MAG: transposase [Acidobacteriota bacterium]
MEVRSAIQAIALEHRRRCYGYRRITAELRRRGALPSHFPAGKARIVVNSLAYFLVPALSKTSFSMAS